MYRKTCLYGEKFTHEYTGIYSYTNILLCTGADSGGGAPGARPPPKKKEKEKERERRGERKQEETIRSIRGKTSAEEFVISF